MASDTTSSFAKEARRKLCCREFSSHSQLGRESHSISRWVREYIYLWHGIETNLFREIESLRDIFLFLWQQKQELVRMLETKFKLLLIRVRRRRESCDIRSPTQTNVSKCIKVSCCKAFLVAPVLVSVLFSFDICCIFLPFCFEGRGFRV